MTNKLGVMKNMTIKLAGEAPAPTAGELSALMTDAGYLRQSSSLINEALQKGFDVLQLANGDIVTTGTKTIVNTYVWDKSNSKLAKAKVSDKKPRAKKGEFIEETLDD